MVGIRLKTSLFQNHIPARGRKHFCGNLIPILVGVRISKPYPRKGTETTSLNGVSSLNIYIDFKTISPQGDGNAAKARKNVKNVCKISKPYPRKGTETTIGMLYFHSSQQFQNHIPARGRKQVVLGENVHGFGISKLYPRKGSETLHPRTIVTHVIKFQNHIPARGRSVLPASPARAGEGDRVSGGGGAMNASCKPS